jgi:hypothetical protein
VSWFAREYPRKVDCAQYHKPTRIPELISGRVLASPFGG